MSPPEQAPAFRRGEHVTPFADIPQTPQKRRRARVAMTPEQYFARVPKPRAKPRHLEDTFHLQAAKYLRVVIGPEGVASPFGVLWYSVETRARRSVREGKRNKDRGCIAGCFDVDLYWPGHALKIEIKSPDGNYSAAQTALVPEYRKAGVGTGLARTLDDLQYLLTAWHVPTRVAK
jgi:hypothetical protein